MDVQQALPFVHSRMDAITARQKLSDRILMHWIEEGVYLESPGETVIGPDVRIGEGTIIEAGVRLEGKTTIGPHCFLGAGSRIVDSELGPQVRVYNSVIEESVMEEGSNIGPFGHLRPASHIGKNVHIGNFVEVKKATLHEGTKAGHLAYIGDAEVGKGVNISCGVIFANYDGKNKHKTIVGDGAFLGSNVNLVAPVIVEEEGFIAAGSTITDTVKKGALAVERAACRHIEGYVEKKREKG